ncbi:MAG: tRNA (guanosine(37)-N1)-methyltransferase TrmD [Ruminococcaceae bacterium]|nr:tRNA (guanosine(37)-N1)-methyltransferase TrmD [Oscillospiraceae bacterium]
MRFDVLTLFPEMIENIAAQSIIGRAQNSGVIEVHAHNIRDYSLDKHRKVDDTPCGGGKGMLMAVPPIDACHEAVKALAPEMKTRTVYMSPCGQVLTQKKAIELSSYDRLIILCGHYEGVDRRAIDLLCDEEISIGDYVLTGGELPACVLIDCVSRMINGVLSDGECFEKESFMNGLLEYPQYTRPIEYKGMAVPDVLLSGDHKKIEKWRKEQSLEVTKKNRPDLI